MKNLFRTNSILVLIIYFFLNPAFTFSQIQTGNFIFEGVPRDYIIFLPQNYNGVDKLPLVFNLHGGSLNAQQQLDYSKMNEVADTVGFIVVYPNAVLTAWSCGINLTEGHVNDVGFIDALIDTLANNYSVDEERIYCCGFSLGGFMCHRLACELSNRIAAIADVAGSIAQHFTTDSTTAHPMPVLKFHGTADQIIPYDGKNDYCSVQQTLTYWANFNHCNLPDTTLLINIDPLDGCTVQKIKYSFSQDIGEVVHYKVLNGGHSWPGGDTAYFTHLGAGPIGNTTMDINASELIWDFFKNYKNPLVDLAYIKSFELSRKYKYYSLSNDTLTVNAYLANPKGHQVVVYAFYQADGSDYQDSLELFDDGLHNDGNASDNFFSGSKHLQNLDEDNYTVELKTYDSNIDKSIKFYLSDQFTTTGPLSVDSIIYAPLSNFTYSVKPFIKNRGSAVSINNIQVKIFSDDPWVTQVYPDYRTCATIAPGEIKPVTQLFAVDYDSTSFPGYFNLKFEISSNRISYWIDSSMMVVTGVEDIKLLPTEYSLYQNYPNPFNPMTTIKYSIPKLGFVTIKVFDVLGSEITTLLNEEKSAGTYELNWNATQLPSGVYFYQLKAGSYVETKKMILLK